MTVESFRAALLLILKCYLECPSASLAFNFVDISFHRTFLLSISLARVDLNMIRDMCMRCVCRRSIQSESYCRVLHNA